MCIELEADRGGGDITPQSIGISFVNCVRECEDTGPTCVGVVYLITGKCFRKSSIRDKRTLTTTMVYHKGCGEKERPLYTKITYGTHYTVYV